VNRAKRHAWQIVKSFAQTTDIEVFSENRLQSINRLSTNLGLTEDVSFGVSARLEVSRVSGTRSGPAFAGPV